MSINVNPVQRIENCSWSKIWDMRCSRDKRATLTSAHSYSIFTLRQSLTCQVTLLFSLGTVKFGS